MYTRRSFAATCPHCGHPFHYVELKFPAVDDAGHWEVDCGKCRLRFALNVLNPWESYSTSKAVVARGEGRYAGSTPVARDKAAHNIPASTLEWQFEYSTSPLYVCSATGTAL